ncbi:hypothetical protein [Methylocystis echinoides]|uniref:hypothetical protein n=1 Tax=Methylocystis echinoides TaxID=29468 RepID=UPI00342A5E93
MTDRKAPGVAAVIPFPRERVSKRRRVLPPPMTRIRFGPELRAYLMAMGSGGRS